MFMEKKNIGDKIHLVIFAIAVIMFIIALAILIPALYGYEKADKEFRQLEEEVITVENNASSTTQAAVDTWWYEYIKINFDELKSRNQDVAGWIRFDNSDVISYPIMYSGDNERYLRKDIDKKYSYSGSIFLECTNNPDFNDAHTIIYGHNMKDMSMFGSLKEYKTDNNYFDENRFFTIYTEKGAYRYQIFSYREISESSSVYTVYYAHDESYAKFTNDMQNVSRDKSMKLSDMDKIVTLSTCSSEGYRFVLHAVRIDEHIY